MKISFRNRLTLSLCCAVPLSAAIAQTEVLVRIENISDQSRLPVELSQGVWLLHQQPGPIFEPGQPDSGNGLETLAEDGLPGPLRSSLSKNPQVGRSGLLNTTPGGASAISILPGETFQFMLDPGSTDDKLSFAIAMGSHNDAFLAPMPQGIDLFDVAGTQITGDVTDQIFLWETGTEVNEATGSGPNQIFVQGAPGDGATPGTVRSFDDSTHALPLADEIVQLSISESAGQFTLNVENITDQSNAVSLRLAPGLFFLQDTTFELFQPGSQDSGLGLEALSEDGAPAELSVSLAAGRPDVDQVSIEGTGFLSAGESYEATVTPSSAFPNVNFLTSIVRGNDAFLGLGRSGVPLVDSSGAPRLIADIEQDLIAALKLYDAGTEENEIPGGGPNQPANQGVDNTGPVDANNQVRLYSDHTNLFDSLGVNGFADLEVFNVGGLNFEGSLFNLESGRDTLSIVQPLWFVHNGAFRLFESGEAASPALVQAATSGDVTLLTDLLSSSSSVSDFGLILNQVSIVLTPGQGESFVASAAADSRFINLFGLITPSNDTFLSLGEIGVALLDDQNNPRPDFVIAQDIQQALSVWDAGAERNEAGAAGTNQPPAQPSATSGVPEVEGTVELFDDPIWGRHRVEKTMRITINQLGVFMDSFESQD